MAEEKPKDPFPTKRHTVVLKAQNPLRRESQLMQEALAKEGSEETLNEIKTGSNRDLNLRSAVNSVGEGEEEKKSGGLFFFLSQILWRHRKLAPLSSCKSLPIKV